MAGEFVGSYSEIVETAGVLIAVAGGVGILLGLIIKEPGSSSAGGLSRVVGVSHSFIGMCRDLPRIRLTTTVQD
ncbi:MAG TPA: hypothetical protein HA256_06775 [Methanoregulaceae archaeon]|jgi:hypothetical protein|nr:hypothetical protein [Methanoregulaceae archaeon]